MHTPLALLAGLALSALAQPGTTPRNGPLDLQRGNEPVQPIQAPPAQSAIPSVKPIPTTEDTPLTGTITPPRRLAEGTFLTTRAGRLVKARTGDTLFLPATLPDSADLPPMVLLPTERLSQIEAAMNSPGFTGDAIIGGQVFVYRGHEYLLPRTFSQPDVKQPDAVAPAPPADSPKQIDTDPRVDDLIKDLESQRSAPRALAPNPLVSEPIKTGAETKGEKPLLQEGALLTFKRARIVRLPDFAGRIAIAFDNDPNSPAPAPMIVQPCAELQRLEALAATRGDTLALKVSGRVYSYKSRNYFLPTLIQTTSPGEVVPMQ